MQIQIQIHCIGRACHGLMELQVERQHLEKQGGTQPEYKMNWFLFSLQHNKDKYTEYKVSRFLYSMHQQRGILLLFSSFFVIFLSTTIATKDLSLFCPILTLIVIEVLSQRASREKHLFKTTFFYVDSLIDMLFYLHRILCGFIIDPCSITVVHHVQTYLSCSPQWKVIFCPIKTNSPHFSSLFMI